MIQVAKYIWKFKFLSKQFLLFTILGIGYFGVIDLSGLTTKSFGQGTPSQTQPLNGAEEPAVVMEETSIDTSSSIFSRAWNGGVIVFSVLAILVIFSILSWAVLVAKFLYLKRVTSTSEKFIKKFWESRSLNDLNSKLTDYPYSPIKEIFRTGYTELIRGSHLKDQAVTPQLAVSAGIENLERSLVKARGLERKKLESYLTLLSIVASASPFIGLFGTVWGIMNAFEAIAKTGNASLTAVAPGISEALIATAFGLAAAIPAVMGYNLSRSKIGKISAVIDGFMADFLNIVERHLVTEKGKSSGHSNPSPSMGSPL